MKKNLIIFAVCCLALLTLATPVLAQTYDTDQTQTINEMFPGLGNRDIRVVILSLVQVALSFVGVILLLVILWGGFQVLISLGDDEKKAKGFRTIVSGIVGTVIILGSYSIASFVINQLMVATGAV